MIEIRDLQKVTDRSTAIDIESLTVKAGEIAALIGPVDSGLETLFDLLIGNTQPTAGTVRLKGIDPYQQRGAFSRQVGVMFAEDNLYARQSAYWNLKFYGRLRRLSQSRAKEVLQEVGLADRAMVRVEDLPSSLARRVAFGRAILQKPATLLLMEPFAKCDGASVSLMSKVLHQMADEGAASLILTDDMHHLDTLCHALYRLNQGRLTQVERPADEQRPAIPFMIPVRLEGKVALVDPADIWYAVAQDDRTSLQTAEALIPTQFSLKELEKRLSRSGFFRAHRSYLVNLQHVKEVIPYTRNSFSLRLKDEAGSKIPLSKSAAGELRELLGY